MTRYKILDELLSDRHHYYDINDLTDICNKKLADAELPTVTRRCIEKDINYLEYDPFFADIERFRVDNKRCLRYENPSFSIFRKELSDQERHLLGEVLATIGQFDGLSNFEWLENLKTELALEERPKIISFSNNPYLKNSNLLGVLFDFISNKVVVKLKYHTFQSEEIKEIIFHPYLLKQYNNRWFLFGAADEDKHILTFALDRLDAVEAYPQMEYEECPIDIFERFEDIIGVTFYEDRPLEKIRFWVSDTSKEYVSTKPIHESQIVYSNDDDEYFRKEYPTLKGGRFFTISCIPNYELIRELCSFGKELIVLEPNNLQDTIVERISEMLNDYSSVRT